MKMKLKVYVDNRLCCSQQAWMDQWDINRTYPNHLRCAGEPLLISTLGNSKAADNVCLVTIGSIRFHSRRLDKAFCGAEHLCAGVNCIENFSRQERPSKTAVGDQVERVAA